LVALLAGVRTKQERQEVAHTRESAGEFVVALAVVLAASEAVASAVPFSPEHHIALSVIASGHLSCPAQPSSVGNPWSPAGPDSPSSVFVMQLVAGDQTFADCTVGSVGFLDSSPVHQSACRTAASPAQPAKAAVPSGISTADLVPRESACAGYPTSSESCPFAE